MKLNCWDNKKCGREPNGVNSNELGICPASVYKLTDGVNSGKNGGRSCWALAGTFCGGKVQGTFSQKLKSCMSCDFYHIVWREENKDSTYTPLKDLLKLIK